MLRKRLLRSVGSVILYQGPRVEGDRKGAACAGCRISSGAPLATPRTGPWPRSSIPALARPSPRLRSRVPPTSTQRYAWPPRPSRRGVGRRPSERSLALIRIADAFEARAEELVRAECREHGQAHRVHHGRGDPTDDRPDPLLRRRRPAPRGPRCVGVHGRPHVLHAARAARRVRGRHAVELPDDDGGVEVRARDRRGKHHGSQALGHHAGHDAADGRDHGRAPAARRVQRRLRRPRHGSGARRARDPRHGVDHRLGTRRHGGGGRSGARP